MKVSGTKLPGVLKIEGDTFQDRRGYHFEIYRHNEYLKNLDINWVQDNISCSKKNVLRGLHGDNITWKLLSCLFGKIFFVVVNYDPDSDYFKQWESFVLTPEHYTQILVPPKYLNGHLILSDEALLHYKMSQYYQGAENQFSVRWNDPLLNIIWPIDNPILSKRDGGQ